MALSQIWTLSINGGAAATAAALGIETAELQFVNQQADTLTLAQTLPPGVTPETPFVQGAVVVLLRDGVVWFRGTIRRRPANLNRTRTILVRGEGWDRLERKAYLQNFQAAEDPSNPESPLVTVQRGRVVLGQDDAGLKVNLTTFLAQVLTYAGLTVGEVDVDVTVPYEDATDLSCAEVLTRLLRWVPNAVLWWDYTTTPATAHIKQRADLAVAALSCDDRRVTAIELDPRDDLVVDHVALIYVATNTANDAAWETVTKRVHPEGTTGEEDGALVRTIVLAGAVSEVAVLTQKVETEPISADLQTTELVQNTDSGPALAKFNNLASFWKKKHPVLKRDGITVVAFRNGTRVPAANPAGMVTPDLVELVGGGFAEWMQEDGEPLVLEEQLVTVDVAYTIPAESGGVQRKTATLTTQIRATNAQSKTYRQVQSASGTAPEEIPEGLEQALYAAMHPLQYDGQIVLEQEEAEALPSVGEAVNVTEDLPEYAEMAALVQSRTVQIHAGRTIIRVGPPKQLGVDALMHIYRTNRTRQPSTSYLVRATGKTRGGGAVAPLPIKQPIAPAQSAVPIAPSVYTQPLTVAGVVPTGVEIKAALEAAYTGEKRPQQGDTVQLTVGGTVKLRVTVCNSTLGGGGYFVVNFAVDGTNYVGLVVQTGMY